MFKKLFGGVQYYKNIICLFSMFLMANLLSAGWGGGGMQNPATTTLNMNNFGIINSSSIVTSPGATITAKSYIDAQGGITNTIGDLNFMGKTIQGLSSVVIGNGDLSQNHNYGVGIGYNAYNNYDFGVGIGNYAYNNYDYGVGVGRNAHSNYDCGVGVGNSADNNYSQGVGVGRSAYSNYSQGVGVGYNAYNNYSQGVGVGRGAYNNYSHGVGVGSDANNNYNYAIGIGAYSKYNKPYGVGLGAYSYSASSSVAIGYNAKCYAMNSLAIGAGTVNYSTGTASFGDYRVIVPTITINQVIELTPINYTPASVSTGTIYMDNTNYDIHICTGVAGTDRLWGKFDIITP